MPNFLVYMQNSTSVAIGLVMMKLSKSLVGTLSLLRRMLSRPHTTQIKLSQSAQGRKEFSRGGSSEPMTVVSIKLDIIIVSEIAAEPSDPLPKNLIDVVGPLAPLKVDVGGPLAPPP